VEGGAAGDAGRHHPGIASLERACTVSKVSRSISGGQAMIATLLSGFLSRLLKER